MVERRVHERVPVHAEVEIEHGGRLERMPAHDISVGGAFLETTLFDHIDMKTGFRVKITLFTDEDLPQHAVDDGHTVHARAKIVRRDPGGRGRPSGLGVVFEELDLENLNRLRALINRAG